MLDDYGFETYENNDFPLAYLITIRTSERGFTAMKDIRLIVTRRTFFEQESFIRLLK